MAALVHSTRNDFQLSKTAIKKSHFYQYPFRNELGHSGVECLYETIEKN